MSLSFYVISVLPGKTLLCWLYIEAWQVYSTPLWNYLTKRRVGTGLNVWRSKNKSRKSWEYKRVGGAPRTSLNAGANRRKPASTGTSSLTKGRFFYMLLASKTDSHVCPTAEDGQRVNYQIKASHIWTDSYKTSMIPQPQTECVVASAHLLPVNRHFLPPGRDEKGNVSPWWRLSRKKKKTIQTFFKNDKVCCRRPRGSNGKFPGDFFVLTYWQQLIIVREKLVFPLFYKHHKRFLLLYQCTYWEY